MLSYDLVLKTPTITISDITLKMCYKCKMYIHPKYMYRHITLKCALNTSDKYKIGCYCTQKLSQNNYSKHLLTPTHINYWNKCDNYIVRVNN